MEGVILQALLMVEWFEPTIIETDTHPGTFYKSGVIDFHKPQVIKGHVLVVPDFADGTTYFVQPHFCRYYARYCKNKVFL